MRKQFLLLLTAILCALNVWAEKPSWVRDGDDWHEEHHALVVFSNLGASAYANRTEIVQVMFATGVSTIGESAFAGCTNITLVMLAEVSNIGNNAFSGCTGLTSITFPNSVTSIGNGAFADCTGFTSLSIPSNVANIGGGAFAGCSNITDVNCYPNAADLTWSDASSDFKASKATRCHVYPSQLSAYQTKFPDANLTFVGDLPPYWVQAGDEWDYETSTLTVNSNPAFQAYQYQADIRHVIFSDAVTNAGEYTFFNCENLITVTIGNNVDTIGYSAFLQCYALTTVTMGNSVRVIGDDAFRQCTDLATIELPNSVTNIKSGAFSYCSSLTTFTIPKNVVELGWQAFRDCEGVTDVYCYPLAANLEWSTSSWDFKDNSATHCHVLANQLSAYQTKFSGASVSFVGDLFDPDPSVWVLDGDVWDADTKTLTVNSNPGDQAYFSNPLIQHVIISGTVTNIGMRAFLQCSALTTVTIPNSVESIGEIAFAACSNLATVTIGNSVTSIGNYGFADCSSLASFTCAAATPPTLGDNVFIDVPTSTCTLYVPKESVSLYQAANVWKEFTNIVGVDVPKDNYVDGIWYNFDDEHLTAEVTYQGDEYDSYSDRYSGKVVIPASVTYNDKTYSVTSIGWSAFEDCSGLTSVTIPSSVTSIGEGAFSGCSSLTSVTIPGSVTSIGEGAFYGCTALTSVTIPNSVTSIEYNAFYNVPNIVYSGSDEGSPWGARSVNGYVDGYLVYSDNTKTTLLACSTSAEGEIVIPNSVTSIGSSAFWNFTDLTSVTIPNSVTSIGNNAFWNCSSLTSVTIPNSVTSIGISAFFSCSGLTSVTIPNSVTSIGEKAFQYCSDLTSVTNYATTPQSINSNVFEYVDKSTCVLNVPNESVSLYQAADGWNEFTNIVGVDVPSEDPEESIETVEGDYTINYVDKDSQDLYDEVVTLHVPVAPTITGFTFVKWRAFADNIEDGITLQAVYQADVPSSAPAVYTNPANPAQKLIKNGNVYILTDDKTYTITGQQVK